MTEFPAKIVRLNEILETSMFAERNFQDVHQVKHDRIDRRMNWMNDSNAFTFILQDLNIPIPNVISLQNHVDDTTNDDGPPASKRTRADAKASSTIDLALATGGTKVLALSTGPIKCNTPICEIIKIVKPVIRALVEDSNLLKMWISFMIPKIEDGNNFGVSVQEDTLGEIQTVESEAAAFFDQISRYFLSRAKIVSKVAKYPHIEDYRRAVQVRTCNCNPE